MILFDSKKKKKTKWEWDNLINRKKIKLNYSKSNVEWWTNFKRGQKNMTGVNMPNPWFGPEIEINQYKINRIKQWSSTLNKKKWWKEKLKKSSKKNWVNIG